LRPIAKVPLEELEKSEAAEGVIWEEVLVGGGILVRGPELKEEEGSLRLLGLLEMEEGSKATVERLTLEVWRILFLEERTDP